MKGVKNAAHYRANSLFRAHKVYKAYSLFFFKTDTMSVFRACARARQNGHRVRFEKTRKAKRTPCPF